MRGRPPVVVRARQSSILGGSSGVVMREDRAGDQRIDDTLRAWLRAGNPLCRTRRRAGRMNRRCFQKRLKTVLLASGRVQQRPDPALGPHETRRDPPRHGRSRIRERVGRSHGAVWVSRQGQHCVLTQLHLGREASATRPPSPPRSRHRRAPTSSNQPPVLLPSVTSPCPRVPVSTCPLRPSGRMPPRVHWTRLIS